MPDRRIPIAAGALVVALALPVFLVADWRLGGWVLGAVLWVGSQLFGLLLGKAGIGPSPTLRASGVAAFGTMSRGIVLMVILFVVALSDRELGVAAALVYALAFTVELALGLTMYFSHPAKHTASRREETEE
jgi:hypothetical protein